MAVLVSGTHDAVRNIERSFTFFFCRACRLRFQNVSEGEAPHLFSEVQESARRVQPSVRRELRDDEEVVRSLRRAAPGGNRLLDVGAGDGWLLAAAKRAGLDCVGTDVSARLAEEGTQRSGAPVRVGALEELSLSPDSFDFINLGNVLMYVKRPRQLIQQASALLRLGGILRIREFDPDSLLATIRGTRYWMYAPTHVNVLSNRSVCRLASGAGLRICRIIPGGETSLATWLAASADRTAIGRFRQTIEFAARRIRLFGRSLAADTVYYFRKPLAD